MSQLVFADDSWFLTLEIESPTPFNESFGCDYPPDLQMVGHYQRVGIKMTTMTLSPVSASVERISTANASDAEFCAASDLAKYERGVAIQPAPVSASALDLAGTAHGIDCGPAMTEDDTVSVLEVLAEMQRIIDRHIEKTERKQGEP